MTATDPAPIPLTEGNAAGAAQVMAALAEPFDPAEVKWKPQSVKGNRALALCYIDARHVMDRLDAVLGSENWQDDYEVLAEGSVVCRLRLGIGGHWITKTDVGSLSEQPDGGDRMKAAFCVPLDAQALTRNGWKTHDELTVTDELLGYDLSAAQCRWTGLTAVNVFPGERATVALRSKSFNADCTPDHRWVVHRRDGGYSLKALRDLDTRDRIVVAAPSEGGWHELTPREAALVGWLATDGSVHVGVDGRGRDAFNAFIFQSKEPQRAAVRVLVGSDGKEHTAPAGERTFPGRDVPSATLERATFALHQPFAKGLLRKAGLYAGGPIDWRDLSPLATRLSVDSRRAMLAAMLLGDGQHSASGQVRFGKKRKPGVLDAFEILCQLEGIALGTLHGSDSAGKIPLRTLRANPHTWHKAIEATPAKADGVWCPTTQLGTWVMKWNGQITITGNSDALKRAAVKFGVGRYLYRLDQVWADYDPQKRKFTQVPALPDWARPKPPAGARKPAPPSPAPAAPKPPAPRPAAPVTPPAKAATPTDFSLARVRDLLVECYGYRESSDAHAADTRLKLLTHLGVPDMDPSQLTRDNLNRLGELCLKIVKKYGAPAPKGSGS